MERLRPVYETGVLRLLLRGNSMLYVALLRSTFDPLTGELPREIVEERFSRSLTRLAETGDYTPKEGQTSAEAAHTILQQLTKEGEGDYAWLANSLDVAAHRYLYRLTARAHRAIEALDRLTEVGLIDDQRFADAWFEAQQRRQRSTRALRHELRTKGVHDELVDQAAAAAALLVLGHVEDGRDRLLLGRLDEGAGVDDQDIGLGRIGRELDAVLLEDAEHDLCVNEILGTAKTDETSFH